MAFKNVSAESALHVNSLARPIGVPWKKLEGKNGAEHYCAAIFSAGHTQLT